MNVKDRLQYAGELLARAEQGDPSAAWELLDFGREIKKFANQCIGKIRYNVNGYVYVLMYIMVSESGKRLAHLQTVSGEEALVEVGSTGFRSLTDGQEVTRRLLVLREDLLTPVYGMPEEQVSSLKEGPVVIPLDEVRDLFERTWERQG